MKNDQKDITSYFFGENFLKDHAGRIMREPDFALQEIVANSWDAGATKVIIKIPERQNGIISFEDNGEGMKEDQFKLRWNTINYNRRKYQGKKVYFPDGTLSNRRPYGRNGKGRHALFCFADSYYVETWRDGEKNKFKIKISKGIFKLFLQDKKKKFEIIFQVLRVYIDKGTIKIKNEIGKNPYCTIIIDKNLLLAILRGMIYARIAFSKGEIKISKKRAIIKMWRIFDLDAIPRKVREMEKNAGFRYSDEKITIHEIFQNMKNVFLPKKARGWKGIIQFDIPNEPYAIYVNNGEVTIKPGRAPTHNLTITIEKDDLRDLATGFLDLKIGAITGLIKVDNIPVGLKFIKMFKIQDLPFTFKRSQLRAKNRVKKT